MRYLRARLSARSLGTGNWYTTVRDLTGHPLQTLSRSDFAASPDRWTGRIYSLAELARLIEDEEVARVQVPRRFRALPETACRLLAEADQAYSLVAIPSRICRRSPLRAPPTEGLRGFRLCR